MATYAAVPTSIPSQQRTARITAAVAGDRIDITSILGRPARGLKIVTGTITDTIEFKLNHLIKMPDTDSFLLYPPAAAPVEVWSGSPGHSTFSVTGALEHTTEEGLNISSIEIESLTGPANIDLIVW